MGNGKWKMGSGIQSKDEDDLDVENVSSRMISRIR